MRARLQEQHRIEARAGKGGAGPRIGARGDDRQAGGLPPLLPARALNDL